MAEKRLVVEHREQLWSLLVEAAQFEHMIMCQYLYACFSLRTEPDEGLTAGQADAVARWQETLTGIAIEEMLHLALVNNVMTAIGAAPTLARPNFPRHSEFLPPGAEFALLPFGADSPGHRTDPAAHGAREPRTHGRRGVPDVLPDGKLRAVATGRLGAAIRTGGRAVPAVGGMRHAGRGSRGGQLGSHRGRGDLGTARRAPAARTAARQGHAGHRSRQLKSALAFTQSTRPMSPRPGCRWS